MRRPARLPMVPRHPVSRSLINKGEACFSSPGVSEGTDR